MVDIDTAKKALFEVLTDRPIAYHVALARISGGVTAGIFLSQLLYWTGKGKDPEGWIYKTQPEWTEETGLTRREQETARKRLRSRNILEEERRSVPARLYYRINFHMLIELLAQEHDAQNIGQTSLAESAKLESRIPPDKHGGKRRTIPENTIQKEQQKDMDAAAGTTKKENQTSSLLIDFGVDRPVAQQLARQCDLDQVRGWLEYVKQAQGLNNPVALVVRRLLDGEPVPQQSPGFDNDEDSRRRYISGKYATYIEH